jgi:bifunctional UDP-N-acetylglucosamine pyrophosphorylase/glucosamine-1-phosphate N-acetyltransferase
MKKKGKSKQSAVGRTKPIHTVILAAGKGTRMGGDLPKALIHMDGQPLIARVMGAVQHANIGPAPLIVVGHQADKVRSVIGDTYKFAHQEAQRGTGHAVSCAREHVPKEAEHIMILYTDHPLLSPQTIQKISNTHLKEDAPVTMATTIVPDFSDWRASFFGFGRVLRDTKGAIIGIKEKRDATQEELALCEVNPSYFCFKADWLWKHLTEIGSENAQHEYYLTDLIAIAARNGDRIASIAIEPQEALGVNTPEDLALAISLL